jgi:hypothetical protein
VIARQPVKRAHFSFLTIKSATALGLEKGYSPAAQEGAALLVSKMPANDAAPLGLDTCWTNNR